VHLTQQHKASMSTAFINDRRNTCILFYQQAEIITDYTAQRLTFLPILGFMFIATDRIAQ